MNTLSNEVISSALCLSLHFNIVEYSLRHTYNTIMKGILTAGFLREFIEYKSKQMIKQYDNPQLVERLR